MVIDWLKHEYRHGVPCWPEQRTNKGWQKPLMTISGHDSGLNGTQKTRSVRFCRLHSAQTGVAQRFSRFTRAFDSAAAFQLLFDFVGFFDQFLCSGAIAAGPGSQFDFVQLQKLFKRIHGMPSLYSHA